MNFKRFISRKFLLWYHKLTAIISVIVYGLPTNRMKVIGVTGTNGKTTTVNLIKAVLVKAGKKTGMISTVNYRIRNREWLNISKITTLGRLQLRKLLKQMLRAGCEYVVIEVSSHAIVQHRVWAINFDTCILTNLTHDHLDYHKDMEEYKKTKGQLFSDMIASRRKKRIPKTSILNTDSRSFDFFNGFKADKNYYYGLSPKAKIKAEDIKLSPSGTTLKAITPKGNISLNLKLVGEFNVYNTLAAIAFGLSENIPLKTIKSALEKFEGVPGRMEKIQEGQNFTVIVDYAHTPDAFFKIFKNLKRMTNKRIVSVFGATGERDTLKRSLLGEIAAQFSSYTFLTLEDPAWEDPIEIMNEIEEGLIKARKKLNIDYFKIVDRREAIRRALSCARPGDIVLLLAKGHEMVMVQEGKKIPWDDRQVAREELRRLLRLKKHAKR